MGIVIADRVASVSEYEALRASVGWRIHPRLITEQALAASIAGVVATQDGLTIGMGRAVGDYLYRLIVDVIVRSDYQRQGVGRQIVKRLTSLLDEPYPPIIGLVTEPGNAEFYQSCGLVDNGDPYYIVPRRQP